MITNATTYRPGPVGLQSSSTELGGPQSVARSSTRLHAPPGGHSQISFGGGDGTVRDEIWEKKRQRHAAKKAGREHGGGAPQQRQAALVPGAAFAPPRAQQPAAKSRRDEVWEQKRDERLRGNAGVRNVVAPVQTSHRQPGGREATERQMLQGRSGGYYRRDEHPGRAGAAVQDDRFTTDFASEERERRHAEQSRKQAIWAAQRADQRQREGGVAGVLGSSTNQAHHYPPQQQQQHTPSQPSWMMQAPAQVPRSNPHQHQHQYQDSFQGGRVSHHQSHGFAHQEPVVAAAQPKQPDVRYGRRAGSSREGGAPPWGTSSDLGSAGAPSHHRLQQQQQQQQQQQAAAAAAPPQYRHGHSSSGAPQHGRRQPPPPQQQQHQPAADSGYGAAAAGRGWQAPAAVAPQRSGGGHTRGEMDYGVGHSSTRIHAPPGGHSSFTLG
jgi:hypothetical protein